MDLVTGAKASLAAKLGELLKEDGILQKGVRKQVESLSRDLESIHSGVLCKVADSPLDELDPQLRSWAGEVREALYDMECAIDNFLVTKECREPADLEKMERLLEKMGSLLNKGKALDEVATTVEDMENRHQEVTKLRGKFKIDDIVAKPSATASTTDPVIDIVAKPSMTTSTTDPIDDIVEPSVTAATTDPINDIVAKLSVTASSTDPIDDIVAKLSVTASTTDPIDDIVALCAAHLIRNLTVADDDASNKKMKILSTVESGGWGKTSLAKEVFDKVKGQFDCAAFVHMGRNPDLQKVFRDILISLDEKRYTVPMMMDLMQLIRLLRKSLINKRFIVVIDDIQDLKTWDIIKCALIEKRSAVLTMADQNIVVTGSFGDIYDPRDLEVIHSGVLCKVADSPLDQLDPQIRSYAGEAREASYNMECAIDHLLVTECHEPADLEKMKPLLENMGSMLNKGKALDEIATTIEDMENRPQEATKWRGKSKIDDIVAKPSTASTMDPIDDILVKPFMMASTTYPIDDIVAKPSMTASTMDPIDDIVEPFSTASTADPIDDIIAKLSVMASTTDPIDYIVALYAAQLIEKLSVVDDDASDKMIKILSVKSEGLGMTSLAKQVFVKVKGQFDCAAFVHVGQNPNMQKVIRDILISVDDERYTVLMMMDLMQLIRLLRKSLINKRFFVVIDNIQDLKAWEIIKCALIENSNRSAVLTTTDHNAVTGSVHDTVDLRHQSLRQTESRKLFWKMLLNYGINYLPDLADISEKLLQTCDGKPSAIIDTVELLRGKALTVKDWQTVYDQRMLAQYPHLVPCLLYFGMFRKGFEICRERLVWGWIANGFIQKTEGMTLKEVGEKYLNDLIERNMIEAVEVDVSGNALSCRVYDLVHDFIIRKSAEDKSATIFDGSQSQGTPLPDIPLPDTVRRLSIQGDNVASSLPKVHQSYVQTLVVCGDFVPSISDFSGLHVLDLRDCDSLLDEHLKGIQNLNCLKSLFIGGKCITGLPENFENLTSLQTLDLRESGVNELPKSVFEPRQLEHLYVSSHMKIPAGIGKMEALLELGDINITNPELLKELNSLTNLRILRIAIWSWDESLKNSAKLLKDNLQSLVQERKNIKTLSILTSCSLDFMDDLGDKWAPNLENLEIRYGVLLKLSGWILSPNLASLSIEVNELSRDIINMLSKLNNLHFLSLTSKHAPQAEFVIDIIDGFKNLQWLWFKSNAMAKMFTPESSALTKLRRLTLLFQASRAENINQDFSFGLEHLTFLEQVRVEIIFFSTSNLVVEKAEAAIRKAVPRDGPNLKIRRRIVDLETR